MGLLNIVADFIWNKEKSPFPEAVSKYISAQSGFDPQAAATVVFYVCRLNRTNSLNISLVHEVEKLLASFIPSDSEIDRMIADAVRASESLETAVAAAGKLASADKRTVISFAEDILAAEASLSMSGDVDSESFSRLFCAMGLSSHRASELIADESARRAQQKKGRMISSGAGLLVAIAVIIVFILAATFLKAVVFGFIFAYFFLPLEKYFEKLFSSNPVFIFADKAFSFVMSPFAKIKDALSEKAGFPADTREQSLKDAASLSRKATFATCVSVALGMLLAVSFLTYFAFSASSSIGNSIIAAVKDMEFIRQAENATIKIVTPKTAGEKTMTASRTETASAPGDEAMKTASPGDVDSESEENPIHTLFLTVRSTVRDYVSENFSYLASVALSKSGSIIAGTYTVLSALGTMLFDLVIFIFFFIFFLEKMAFYTLSNKQGGSDAFGHMVVNSIFNSGWLPATSRSSKKEASVIIGRISFIFNKWVRGYLSVIMIEFVLYTVLFLIFRVPYAPILGVIAGSTILLPVIGPLASFLLTAGLCVAFVDSHLAVTLIGVGISYLVLHGIVEQLILYPYFVGESIGLTTLETIIVVLLGAMLAGITGMIFAVPAAAVLKYLIPEIYRVWMPVRQKN